MIGVFMLGIEGTQLTDSDIRRLSNPMVGGVLILSRNYINPSQLTCLTNEIKNISTDLIIAVDQEGGRVQRLDESFTKLPAMESLGEVYNDNQEASIQYVEDCATIIAYELKEVGIDLSFAPVLDLNKGNLIIGNRSFSDDPDMVTKLGGVFIDRMRYCGMLSVGKHFPGHGSATGDTHTAKIYDDREFTQIMKTDLKPFNDLIKMGKLDAVMLSHIIYSDVSNQPASLSKEWIWDILRKQLKFLGIIFSDDLNMVGASNPKIENIESAFSAGCDMMLVCNDFEYMDYILRQITYPQVDKYCKRITRKYNQFYSKLSAVNGGCSKEEYEIAVLNLSQLDTH